MGKNLRAVPRKKRTRKITFVDWIDSYGVMALSKELGVHHSTVVYWKTRATQPRGTVMRRIIELSGGTISYEQMIPAVRG